MSLLSQIPNTTVKIGTGEAMPYDKGFWRGLVLSKRGWYGHVVVRLSHSAWYTADPTILGVEIYKLDPFKA